MTGVTGTVKMLRIYEWVCTLMRTLEGDMAAQPGIAEVEGCVTFTTETGTDTEMTDCDMKEGMIGRGVWGGSLVVVTMMVCFFD